MSELIAMLDLMDCGNCTLGQHDCSKLVIELQFQCDYTAVHLYFELLVEKTSAVVQNSIISKKDAPGCYLLYIIKMQADWTVRSFLRFIIPL